MNKAVIPPKVCKPYPNLNELTKIFCLQALDQDRSTLQKFWVQLTKLDHSLLLHLFAVNIRDNSQTIRDFLDVIMRSMSTDVHQRLWNGVAGIEPDLFANVFGFSPSREEKGIVS